MNSYYSSSVFHIVPKAFFLGRIREIPPGSKEEDHIVFLDCSGPEVIQLVADDKFEAALPGKESSQEFLVTRGVVSPSSHVEDLDLAVMVSECGAEGEEKKSPCQETVGQCLHEMRSLVAEGALSIGACRCLTLWTFLTVPVKERGRGNQPPSEA